MKTLNADDTVRKIENSTLAIYGTGGIGLQFYNILKIKGLKNTKCFVVTHLEEPQAIDGIPVLEAGTFLQNEKLLVCVAVHEFLLHEITKELENLGVKNFIWVYPYMIRLYCGKQIAENQEIVLNDILNNNNDYRVAIRYMAVEDYYGKNDYGFDIYRHYFEKAYGKEVAKNRVAGFKDLIKSYEKNGYLSSGVISIDSDYFLLDGAHRVALACYHGIEKLRAEIYPKADGYFSWNNELEFVTDKTIPQMDFSETEIGMIKAADRFLKMGKRVGTYG